MKSISFTTRLAALPLALCAAIPAYAQTQLKEVVVTATRFGESAQSAPYAVSVISADDIRASGATSVSEAINRLLGVSSRLDTSGGGNYSMDLRGFGGTSDRNQVVIVDGRRLKDDDLSATNLSVIPIETVDRIEVLRGSGAVQYGEGATAGVIVVTTKAGKGISRKNSGLVGASIGSFGAREAHASAVLAKSNGHRDNFASTADSLSSTAQWSDENLRVGAVSGRQLTQSGWPGGLSAAQYAANPEQATSLINFGTTKSEYSGVFAEYLLDQWEFALDANVRTKIARSRTWGSDVAANNANVRARHTTQGAQLGNSFVVGLDTAQWSGQDITAVLSDSQSSALYLTDDVTLVPSQTRISAGVRTESVNKKRSSSTVKMDEHPLAWHLGVNQAVAPTLSAYARVGGSYRLPTADEFTFTQPSVVLQTQTSRDSELGLRWMQDGDKAEVRLYRNDLTNELGYDPVIANSNSFNGVGANVNFDPTRRQGIEVEVHHSLTKAVDLRGNAAWREAKFVGGAYSGNDVALVPRQTISVGASWRVEGGHMVDAVVNWVSSQSPTFSNQCEMPAYSTVDARYAFTTDRWDFSLGAKNLTDAKYYTQAFKCTAGVTNSIYPEAGRALTASAQLRF
jgi:iron complex outermembrane receptor protein